MQLLFISIFIVVISIFLLLFLWYSRRNFGSLTKKNIYFDTSFHPGQVLRAKTIPLVGKPDYLIQDKGHVIPVEIKTGRAPDTPRQHHVMQLMAYCYLVEEKFGKPPPIGILKYPHREFKVAYSPAVRAQVKSLVYEILQMKNNGEEPTCHHPHHNE